MKPTITLLLLAVFTIGLYGQTEVQWDSIMQETIFITRIPPVTELPYESKKIPDTYELLPVPDTIRIRTYTPLFSYENAPETHFLRQICLPDKTHSIIVFNQEEPHRKDRNTEWLIVVNNKTKGLTYVSVPLAMFDRTDSTVYAHYQWKIDPNLILIEIAYHNTKGKELQRVEDVFRFKDGYFIRVRRDEYEPMLYDTEWLNDANNNIWDGNERLIKTEETPYSEQQKQEEFWKEGYKKDMENYKELKRKNKQ